MNLTELKNHWKEKIDRWVLKQTSKDRCGVWPVQFPRWFPFTSCCKLHDTWYVEARSLCLQQAAYKNISLLEPNGYTWLLTCFKPIIEQGDSEFSSCLNVQVTEASVLKKFFLRRLALAFTWFVEQYGWRVWLRYTMEEFAESQFTEL